jgi:ACT domain-containing protein
MKTLRKLINTEVKKALKEVTANSTDMAKIEDFVMSSPQFERLSTSKMKAAVKDMQDEWKASASNYKNIEAYFKEMEEMGDEEAFMENKMSKTKKMVKRLKEDTEYQEFFKKAMDKFKINSPADLKDPAKKKQFFDYIDTNYKAKVETINEVGSQRMAESPVVAQKVKQVIDLLMSIDIDGETMQYILEEVGMDEQMQQQLTPGGIR